MSELLGSLLDLAPPNLAVSESSSRLARMCRPIRQGLQQVPRAGAGDQAGEIASIRRLES